ncbi:DNA replication and repair protein RecF [soil metagenome]
MHLENISLINFKNYSELELQLSPYINCFVGDNGSGKTNLLDAINYLSLTKSAFNSVDSQNIRHNSDFFTIKGNFQVNDKKQTVLCIQKSGQKKVLKKNNIFYEKISDHIGQFPVVMIAPDDTDIIREGSDARRRFLDSIISQINSAYLENLILYNHYLKQRNSLLKHFALKNYIDHDLLEPYDRKLIHLGSLIYKEREKFIAEFLPVFVLHYNLLSEGKETTHIVYNSDLQQQNLSEHFLQNLKKDLVLQRTNCGIHKDDLLFEIEGFPLKKFGSQGHQKSFLIGLKLSQFEIIKNEKSFPPLLLLDDIFDKLDDHRISKLLEMVSSGRFGQIFITDARPERSERIFSSIKMECKIFKITDGAASEVI